MGERKKTTEKAVATEMEKVVLCDLQAEIKQRVKKLRRAEHLMDEPPCLHQKDSSTFSLFCQSNLLNVKGKIFFSVLAQSFSIFLEGKIIDGLMHDLANAFGSVPHKIL